MAPGFKTGGRIKGSKNKKTLVREALGERQLDKAIKALGRDAFNGDAHSFLVAIYKDGRQPTDLRLDAAKAAIRFEKPALGSIEQSIKLETRPAELMTDDELAAIAGQSSGAPDQAPVDPSKFN